MPFARIECLNDVGGIDLNAVVAQVDGVARNDVAKFHHAADRVLHLQSSHSHHILGLHDFQPHAGGIAHHDVAIGELCLGNERILVFCFHSEWKEQTRQAYICYESTVHQLLLSISLSEKMRWGNRRSSSHTSALEQRKQCFRVVFIGGNRR